MTDTTSRPGTAEITVNGQTVDLVKMIGTLSQLGQVGYAEWVGVQPQDVKLGETAYVHALGDWRRGVVTKVGKSRVSVAFTTRGAVDEALRYRGGRGIRVQDSPKPVGYVRVYRPDGERGMIDRLPALPE